MNILNKYALKEAYNSTLTTEAVANFVESVQMGAYYDGIDERWLPVMCAVQYAQHIAAVAICLAAGHKMCNEGWCGPDSGGEAAHCERCGWGFSVTYY